MNSSEDNNKTVPAAKKPKNKNRKSIGWVIGIVILILISITFVLPTTIFSTGSAADTVLGTYNGKKIKLSDTYLQNQISNLANQYGGINSIDTYIQVLTQAYQTTVYAEALGQMAKSAGFKVTDEAVDNMIIESGIYNDENGNFSADIYNSTDRYSRDMTREMIATQLPALTVQSEIVAGMQTADAELELISALAAYTRTFDYVLINSTSYPAAKTEEYAMGNPKDFMQVGVSILSVADEETAKGIYDNIMNGTTTFEAAVSESSTDSYKSNAGSMGEVFFFELSSLCTDELGADKVFSTGIGEISEPIATTNGYSIFKVNSEVAMADFTDADTVRQANAHIASVDPDLMNAYIDETEATFSSRIANGEDFLEVASDMGLTVVNVSDTNANPAGFPLLSSFSYTDPSGYLYYATATDTDLTKTLFSSDEGTVLPAISTNGAKIVVKVGAEKVAEEDDTTIESIYPYLESGMYAADVQNAVFSSSKFEDNFYEVLFSQLLSSN